MVLAQQTSDTSDDVRGVRGIIGPPGTGKTTEISRLVERVWKANGELGHPAMVCSLTVAAASEAAGRDLPIDHRMIGTLHSHAYRALGGSIEIATDAKLAGWNHEAPMRWRVSADGARDESVEIDLPEEEGSSFGPIIQAHTLCRQKMLTRGLWPSEVQEFDAAWTKWKREEGLKDFTDLIEDATTDTEAPMNSPSVMFVDEAQDFSQLELRLLRHWATGGSVEGLVLVGDDRQALYQWRGADPDMFQAIDPDRLRVLSQSYRVPARIHEVAVKWASTLSSSTKQDYLPTQQRGIVEFRHELSYMRPQYTIRLIRQERDAGRSVMVTTACGYMLQEIIDTLRRAGLPFCNPWRRKAAVWNPLAPRKGVTGLDRLKALVDPLAEDKMWTKRQVSLWMEVLRTDKLLRRGAKRKVAAWKDVNEELAFEELRDLFVDIIAFDKFWSVMMEQTDVVDKVKWWQWWCLETKSSSIEFPCWATYNGNYKKLYEEPQIYVGSIHSFKGSECDTVILFPDLSPRGTQAFHQRGQQRDSVIRQFYVGMTRAKKKLFIAQPDSRFKCVPLNRYL